MKRLPSELHHSARCPNNYPPTYVITWVVQRVVGGLDCALLLLQNASTFYGEHKGLSDLTKFIQNALLTCYMGGWMTLSGDRIWELTLLTAKSTFLSHSAPVWFSSISHNPTHFKIILSISSYLLNSLIISCFSKFRPSFECEGER
jgi:hypothetical protein